ncbi:MAG: ABC transporter substrate-binding protein [Actinomycetota bacterium]|nr:ABC transporter substrate-binding protein [Actinomycetota bacterium]
MRPIRRLVPLAAIAIAAIGLVAPNAAGAAPKQGNVTLRLGYFPNVTHATAIVGVEGGLFTEKLGNNVQLETSTFNAGPAAIEALNSDAIDATYIGPNPAINAYAQSNGEAIRIVSGATSGGAFLVVKPGIKGVKDLKGKKVASPQLGNTQDVALRTYLKQKGLKTDTAGGGDVSIVPQENAQTLDLFKQGQIDGAWVPEPWATRLVQEGGGKVLVDERKLWPEGRYVTTQLVVRTQFLKDHPDAVKKLLEGQVAANDLIKNDTTRAEQLVGQGIDKATGKPIAPELITASFNNLVFTNDPIASSLRKSAKDAQAAGLLKPVDLKGIYSLKLLNQVLKQQGEPTVKA